jgi:hypothetical protein
MHITESLFYFHKWLQARKPYTITKQRERWSEEEHLRYYCVTRLAAVRQIATGFCWADIRVFVVLQVH